MLLAKGAECSNPLQEEQPQHHGGQCGWSCRVKVRKLEGSKGRFYPESQRELGPVDTLTLDFESQDLWDNKYLFLSDTHSVDLCSSSPRELIASASQSMCSVFWFCFPKEIQMVNCISHYFNSDFFTARKQIYSLKQRRGQQNISWVTRWIIGCNYSS